MRSNILMEIVSPRGNIMRIPKWQYQTSCFYTKQIIGMRGEAVKAWMEQERMMTDGKDFCTRV